LPDSNETNSSLPILLEVERFEHVSSGSERVLLRLDGSYTERTGKRVLDAMLFVDDGLAVHRHAPLPDIGDDNGEPVDGWLWRAAFDVPACYLTDARTRFALEANPGSLLDLPRPTEVATSTSIPITARAAHLARRYAAAVAIVLAVAVAPGGLPAQARTEVLRVHHADGSVIYMTTDGRRLAELPPDAVIIDQPAPAATAPDPAAEQAPAPDQQPAPQQTDDSIKSLNAAADAAHAQSGASEGRASSPPKRIRRPNTQHHAPARENGDRSQADAAQQRPDAGAQQSRDAAQRKHRSNGKGAAGGRPIAPLAGPDTSSEPLQPLPALVAASPDSALEPIARMTDQHAADASTDATATPAPATPVLPPTAGDLPSKDLHPLDELSGGASAPDATAPDLSDVPALITDPPAPDADGPRSGDGRAQGHSGSSHHVRPQRPARSHRGNGGQKAPDRTPSAPSGAFGGDTGGSFDPGNFPSSDALPGPVEGVPNFVIQKFHVPPFLLPIYQAAGIQYGVRWEVLAAINEIETDYGRNLNVSSAGALGWMQFMPATWKMYGVDANKDGKRDPYNPVDAIFSSARYLKAAGAGTDIRKAIFAYNHAGWYVDSVMLRARLIAGYPTDLIGSLTGLTEARFPVAARARYAGDLSGKDALKTVPRGHNAANVVNSDADRRSVDIFARKGAPVVAVNDGVVKDIGYSRRKGRYVVLQDVYGNRFTYSHLGSLAKFHPVPNGQEKRHSESDAHATPARDPKPDAPASAGTHRPGAASKKKAQRGVARRAASRRRHAPRRTRVSAIKQRLFAHPTRAVPRRNGGLEQQMNHKTGADFETYDNYFARALGLNSHNATLRPLKKGSHVVGSTVLGRIGAAKGSAAPHVHFEIRPAGRGAPTIDPKPFLDGWKLLESTNVYRASGKNVLYGDGDFSIGEIMLLPKSLLAKRVLSDPRIKIYPGGRQDIESNQVDRRVLVVLAYLAESGLDPTVSSLKGNHGLMTSSGNVSEHSSGNAVDISAINGVPIIGHQGAGDVTESAVKRLMQLQGTMRPHQIISLLDFGQNTLALGDHDDHIHVGFHPLFGENSKLGRETRSVLKPGQWDDLVQRLGEIENPNVPTHASKYAIPDSTGSGE
jgi:murein DD-endopeptidase MepM/ murein hydrolase activator NlpD